MNDHRQGNFFYSSQEQRNGTTSWFRKMGPDIQIASSTLLEYSGAFLGIAGWLGVRQIGSPEAQELGFAVWILSGLLLVAWGYHKNARAIMLINAVNVLMAASAFVALV